MRAGALGLCLGSARTTSDVGAAAFDAGRGHCQGAAPIRDHERTGLVGFGKMGTILARRLLAQGAAAII